MKIFFDLFWEVLKSLLFALSCFNSTLIEALICFGSFWMFDDEALVGSLLFFTKLFALILGLNASSVFIFCSTSMVFFFLGGTNLILRCINVIVWILRKIEEENNVIHIIMKRVAQDSLFILQIMLISCFPFSLK